jgi:hypothetical protein
MLHENAGDSFPYQFWDFAIVHVGGGQQHFAVKGYGSKAIEKF